MKGLIIDTSTEKSFVGLSEEGIFTAFILLEGTPKLCPVFFPSIETLLRKKEIVMKELDFIAVGVGPGSYMGLRTGATAGKTLSYGASLPLVSFCSPFAFLPPALKEGEFGYVGDAKMGQAFFLKGHKSQKKVVLTQPPLLCSPVQLESLLTDLTTLIIDPKFASLVAFKGELHFPEFTPSLIASSTYAQFLVKDFLKEGLLPLHYLRECF